MINIKLWEEDYIIVNDLLEQCINTGKKWNSACTHLTQLFWPNYSLHPWTGESYTPQSLSDLINRLEEVNSLRTIHRQLTSLLNQNEIEDLRTSDFFRTFKGIFAHIVGTYLFLEMNKTNNFADVNVLNCGPYSETAWRTAVIQFEYLLLPAEQTVGEKLKLQLSSVSNNTRQVYFKFSRNVILL